MRVYRRTINRLTFNAALAHAGCETVFEYCGVSGAATKRSGLDAALARVQAGDVLVAWKLDRLGRSLPHLIHIIQQLGERARASVHCRKASTLRQRAASSCFISSGRSPTLSVR